MATKIKTPKQDWDYYQSCIRRCLRDLSERTDGVTTRALARHFLNNRTKAWVLLTEMERRGYVRKTVPMYNLYLWHVTDSGQAYLKES